MTKQEVRMRKLEMAHETALETIKTGKELVIGLVSNPVFDMVAGAFLIEWAKREGYIGDFVGTAALGALVGVCMGKAVAPLLPFTGKDTGEIMKWLTMAGYTGV